MRKKEFFILLFVCVGLLEAQGKHEHVVCIHGFLGAPWNMHFLAKNLSKKGWQVTNFGYASRDDTIDAHAKKLVKELQTLAKKNPEKPIHFVAHSMGCLVLRSALNHPECPKEAKTGRMVLLTPPNQGSVWARFLQRFSWFRSFAKDKAGKELSTAKNFDHLGDLPPSLEKVLVIAGDFGFNPFIPEKNDGTVGVSETCLNTPHEHMILSSGHKTILFSKETFAQIYHFLKKEI